MKKRNISLRTLVTLAVFVAANIILTRIFVLYITDFVRLDLGNVPLILAGLYFGPAAGALTGAASDLLGVMLSGRGWYPPLTVGPILMGLLPGLLRIGLRAKKNTPFPEQGAKKVRLFGKLFGIIALSELLAAILWKTYWLSVLYGMSYSVCLAARVPAILALLVVESILIYILYKRIPRTF